LISAYEVIVSAVRDRADLLDRTLRSMLAHLDVPPARIIVHEDTRPGHECLDRPTTRALLDAIAADHGVPIVLLERNPGTGLGLAMLRLLEAAQTEIVLYTQEDFDFVRVVPAWRCVQLMDAHQLHHVRFNKRKTMRVKAADKPPECRFTKVEVQFSGVPLCISDHWYFQASLWRREMALEAFRALAAAAGGRPYDRCEAKFNHWMNTRLGGGIGSTDATGAARRGEVMRTFIWGPVGESAFIAHTGHDRRSQGWEK
jgi:hypothetical protein